MLTNTPTCHSWSDLIERQSELVGCRQCALLCASKLSSLQVAAIAAADGMASAKVIVGLPVTSIGVAWRVEDAPDGVEEFIGIVCGRSAPL